MQNFTGVSRRQRQVNLSGKSASPSSKPGHLGVSASSVAHAREVRAQRETERRRNKAVILLQSTLRGYLTRKRLYSEMRSSWDAINRSRGTGMDSSPPAPLEERLNSLALLLVFWDAYNEDDQKRLVQTTFDLGPELAAPDIDARSLHRWRTLLARCSKTIIFKFLSGGYASQARNEAEVIQVLGFLTRTARAISGIVGKDYYLVVSQLVQHLSGRLSSDARLRSSVQETTFQPMFETDSPSEAFDGFVFGALARPSFLQSIGLDDNSISSHRINVFRLSEAVLDSNLSDLDTDEAEWILAHLIHLNRRQSWIPSTNSRVATGHDGARDQDLTCTACVAKLLELCGPDISARWDSVEPSGGHWSASTTSSWNRTRKDEARKSKTKSGGLPQFVKDELEEIRKPSTINSLVSSLTGSDTRRAVDVVAQFVAALLTTFPDSRRDIQQWLHLARTAEGETCLQFFWRHVSHTPTFAKCKNVDTALQCVKSFTQGLNFGSSRSSARADWVILIAFLTMIEFSYLLLDDEEFFKFLGPSGHSMQVSDLKELCLCLKHIGFVSFWSETEILDDINRRESIGKIKYDQFVGLRDLVVKILRILHHRDSRRRFLPADHWLMTTEIDMTSIIPQVVAEEEKRHLKEEEEDTDDSESENDEKLANPMRHRNNQRILSAVTPRLAILENLPFLIPFNTRLLVFREFVRTDRRRRLGYADADAWRFSMLHRHNSNISKHAATVQRGMIFDDAFEALYPLNEGLKDPIQITFVDSFGEVEAGIDGGGVTKEFLMEITKEAFGGVEVEDDSSSSFNAAPLFVPTENHTLYPNPTIFEEMSEQEKSIYRKRYEFLGRIVGKALYEEILLEATFAPFFLLKFPQGNDLLGGIDDLRDLDEGLWNSLQKLKYYDDDTLNSLGLTFTTDISVGGKVITKELVPGGENKPVTPANKLTYMLRLARFKLVEQNKMQTNCFITGLSQLISRRWLSMFNQSELQRLIGGDDQELDLQDWKENTVYGGVYDLAGDNMHQTIKLFWQVMEELDDAQRRLVLKFVTACPRAPLLGFSALSPKFAIRDAGSDTTRLLSASTCVSLLKLPMYKDKRTLKEKLLYAVTYGAGFDLS